VARFGGEEFVVVLPDIDAANGWQMAEKIRQDVEGEHIPYPESDAGPWLTVSLGGATQVPSAVDVDAGLFDEADRCLYEAKHNGRNQAAWSRAAVPQVAPFPTLV
jgi:diguanylate cyclase (GGDEF)-like protein